MKQSENSICLIMDYAFWTLQHLISNRDNYQAGSITQTWHSRNDSQNSTVSREWYWRHIHSNTTWLLVDEWHIQHHPSIITYYVALAIAVWDPNVYALSPESFNDTVEPEHSWSFKNSSVLGVVTQNLWISFAHCQKTTTTLHFSV